jgi:hypothetical protein
MFEVFLDRGKPRGFITFELDGAGDEYVQLRREEGSVLAEVGSRQWEDPERPLPPDAVARLAELGFTGGGPERNFVRAGLRTDANELAELTDKLFVAAYDVDDDYQPILHRLQLNDVAPPRAKPFSRDMVEALLRKRGVKFWRDQDGDFRADLACPGSDEAVVVVFTADGEDGTLYRVSAGAPRRPQPGTRLDALERCNTWNSTRRWPYAAVLDTDDGWRILLDGHLDVGPGITAPLLDRFTDRVVEGALEFWEWIVHPEGAQARAAEDAES